MGIRNGINGAKMSLASTMLLLLCCGASAFVCAPRTPARSHHLIPTPGIRMGLFDRLKKAFDNADYAQSPAMYEQTNARASHILVPTEEQALEIKAQLERGELLFDEAASRFSTCNSRSRGGKLGKFNPGTMVPEFDDVVFGVEDDGIEFKPKYEVGVVNGPVQTQFGFHLIKIETRNMANFDFRQQEQAKGTL